MHPVARAWLVRLATLVASLLASSLVVFLVIQTLPGDLAEAILGTSATPERLAVLRAELGLDRPWYVRYGEWLAGFARGDLGVSALSGRPVWALIRGPLGVTTWLVLFGTILSLLVALPLGLWSAMRRRHADGVIVNATSHLGMSIPAFLAGLLLVVVFAVQLRVLPANGFVALVVDPVEWARHLVLPVVALGLVQGALLTRYVRSAFVEVLGEDHLRTARAIGWTRLAAVLRHGLRPAGLSIITVLGLQLVSLLVGAIVIENVFVLPGLGSQLMTAVNQRDLLTVQGIVMLLVAAVLVINAVVDLLYLALDPRLRTGGSSSGPTPATDGVPHAIVGAPVEVPGRQP
ncbi:ABC transporter permease [Tessaracoccus sp. SD287]|uniref:ABC transporter permease n=1 Tax=Tessaracoccus sp. SD287 TaxID=2782008 RepID=UPI001A96445E|nr:ABC transporter permease [Tessaracoccus sp. SD287]MBO1030847.1 ABC transporter permease [Tessaracoccus sp. SD287]